MVTVFRVEVSKQSEDLLLKKNDQLLGYYCKFVSGYITPPQHGLSSNNKTPPHVLFLIYYIMYIYDA